MFEKNNLAGQIFYKNSHLAKKRRQCIFEDGDSCGGCRYYGSIIFGINVYSLLLLHWNVSENAKKGNPRMLKCATKGRERAHILDFRHLG